MVASSGTLHAIYHRIASHGMASHGIARLMHGVGTDHRVSTQPDVVSVEELYDEHEVLPTTYNPFHETEPETRCSTRAIITAQSTQSTRASSLIIAEDLSMPMLSLSLSLSLSQRHLHECVIVSLGAQAAVRGVRRCHQAHRDPHNQSPTLP